MVSIIRRTFAVAFKERDLAQLVAHTSGGREVAGSSPVIPTDKKGSWAISFPFYISITLLLSMLDAPP